MTGAGQVHPLSHRTQAAHGEARFEALRPVPVGFREAVFCLYSFGIASVLGALSARFNAAYGGVC